jgi:hypothetical protein
MTVPSFSGHWEEETGVPMGSYEFGGRVETNKVATFVRTQSGHLTA